MKLTTKIALSIFILGIIVIGSYIYLVFNGNPFMKHKISLQEKAYAESKYGFHVKMVKADYDFKGGSYQTSLKPENKPAFLVYQTVQPGGKKVFEDTYAETQWSKEIKEQTFPTIKNLFQDASKIDINVPIDTDFPFKGSKIPSYKETNKVPFQIDLTLNSSYSNQDNQRIFSFVDFLKKEGYTYGVVSVRFEDKTIFIPSEQLNSIQSENDISQFVL